MTTSERCFLCVTPKVAHFFYIKNKGVETVDIEMTLSIDDLFQYLEHTAEMNELVKNEKFNEEYEDEPKTSNCSDCFDDAELSAIMFKQIMKVVRGSEAVSAHIAYIVNDYKQRYKVPPEHLPVISVFANAIECRESNRLLQKAFADRRHEEARLKEQRKKRS